MRLKFLALFLVLALVCVSMIGCDRISFTDPAVKRRESISKYIDGNIPQAKDVAAETGKTYNTKWFDFTIHSIDKTDAYGGYKTKEGNQLYNVLITLKSTCDEPIPMGTFDFYLDAPDFAEYIWPIPPLDDTMMPEKYDLAPGEAVQYIMLFEVPTDTAGLILSYTETADNGVDGATFSIAVE